MTIIDCATTLLLTPRVTQIYNGNETGRKLNDAKFNVNSNQAFRSDIDWTDNDKGRLDHYKCLGKIRRSNPVIGIGRLRTIDTHTFLRYNDTDSVMIVLKPEPGRRIVVNDIFEKAQYLRTCTPVTSRK